MQTQTNTKNDIPSDNTRPIHPLPHKSYDRKSSSFYDELATIYDREAHSLETSKERFAGKAEIVRQLRKQAKYHRKMANWQVANGIDRRWIK